VADQGSDRRARIAAQRATAQRTQTRNRILIAGGAIVAVVGIVLGFVLAGGNSPTASSSGSGSAAPAGQALASLVTTTTSVPAATMDRIGAGTVSSPPKTISGAPLTSGGKPEVLYIGAEYCPYCAAERWAVVTALSKFGSFTGLEQTHSSSVDTYPNTPTFSFHGATYSSSYLSFSGVETTTNQPQGSFYAKLDTPTPAQAALFQADTGGYIPFVDIGGKFVIKNPQYVPNVLAGMTVDQVAAAGADPSTAIGKAIEASAGKLVAAICQVTGDQPASVCSAFTGAGGGT